VSGSVWIQRNHLFAIALAAISACALLLGPPSLGQSTRFGMELVGRSTVEARLRQVTMKNAKRQAVLRQLFEEAGCTGASLVEQTYQKKDPPNLICTLPGTGDSAILIGAHFDHSNELGEGVVDDWSGAALLPSLYQTLCRNPRRHTLLFIGFGGEEKGLLGSKYYVGQMSDAQASKARAMVNLECLGLGPTKVWASHSDQSLLFRLAGVGQMLGMPLAAFNPEQTGGTAEADSDPFLERKIPTLDLHSLTERTLPLLHSTLDNQRAIRLDDYYGAYQLVATYLAYLDTTLP